MVGNPGLGIVIIIACVQLPLTSFSSIQMALFRREFDFKTLFFCPDHFNYYSCISDNTFSILGL
ncbi:oligosaccharide flippase family protein [Bacillus paranthracis]